MTTTSLHTSLLVPKGAPLAPGKMYLRLYHGRTDPAEAMDDWGFDGPTFGPLACYVHTYCCTFRIHGESGNEEVWLDVRDYMIHWDGCFYLRRPRGIRCRIGRGGIATMKDDEFWDDLFHACAFAAFIDQAAEEGGPPDMEATRRRAFAYYEHELAARNRRGG